MNPVSMDEERKLYPLKTCILEDKFSWGSVRYGIADLGYRDTVICEGWLAANSMSEIMETYLDRVVGESVYERFGRQFPVQIKRICVEGSMPLAVCPDDTVAADRYDALGKEIFWYVESASAGAELFLGFENSTDASSLLEACADGTVTGGLLHRIVPKAGESYLVKPGTVHCARGKMTIIEVSESSGLDFLLSPFGQSLGEDEFDEEFNAIEALDFIDYGKYVQADANRESPIFTVGKISLTEPLHVRTGQFDSFVLYHCLSGEAVLKVKIPSSSAPAVWTLKASETILVPAEVAEFELSSAAPQTSLLEVYVPKAAVKDAYINPYVPQEEPEDGSEEENNEE